MVTYGEKMWVNDVSGATMWQVMRLRWFGAALAAVAIATMSLPSTHIEATAPPDTVVADNAPLATNDLLPDQNNLNDCVGTAEPANCGSRARADGHTYLVFLALAAGLGFIGWRIGRGVKARDRVSKPAA
ncbi:MAG: hypothetical protein QOE00_1454 [Ilumatobacteraceae bacterium]